ncbi:MAG: succinate CoA transferase [Bacteroidales bacterium]|nr:succinate CoA transferase [Bacteroidales bacterium]MDY4175024.1 succinate CoA transferase [Bacteroidales bacterium]
MRFPELTAEEAAEFIKNDYVVGIGGFSSVGTPKAVPTALAKKAEAEHAKGNAFRVGLITGGATGDPIDGALARAHAVKFRTPFQSHKDMRAAINSQEVQYFDLNLSHVAQDLRYGFLGHMDVCIIEASSVTDDGLVVPTSSVGISPTLCESADKIIIELNAHHPEVIRGMHDIYEPINPPYRREIPIFTPADRVGTEAMKVDPAKVLGIVRTNLPDTIAAFTEPNPVTTKIGQNVAEFLINELRKGIIPKEFLPLQSGVGNIANAVLGSLGECQDIPPFTMFTEVIQNSVIPLMESGRISFASGSSLTLSDDMLSRVYGNLDFFKGKLMLRPQEITNHPELIRRMGIIAINTALEMDIFGNVNSTNVSGQKMMNGIGGSADFARNAFLSIFTCPSVAKGGVISAIVPMVTHTDSNEHSVKIVATEYGVADLRGKSPLQKAHEIIEKCVHPDYKQLLWDYLKISEGKSHTPMSLAKAFAMHIALAETGDMRNAKF